MKELMYSIFRYAPSLVSGEKINLAAIFYYPDTDYREFYTVNNWSRVRSFDDSLCIPLMKDLLLDMKDAVGSPLTSSEFNMYKFCAQYHSELHFDECIILDDVDESRVSKEIEDIKRLYFQFEYELEDRPKSTDQKKFLGRLLRSKKVLYHRNAPQIGRFEETICYDFVFEGYGVKFFDFNHGNLDGNTINKVKAWAWNCLNAPSHIKTVILYDLVDEGRKEAKPLLDILRVATPHLLNIHGGFSDVMALIGDDRKL